MSSASRSSWMPGRRPNSNRISMRPRGASRGNITVVSHDDAYTFALRIAYLNYLLQPRQKRKQYVAAPKPAQRSHTSVTELVGQFVSSGSNSIKLPHGFQKPLEKRIKNVLTGKEPMQGFNDSALKRSFAEAYTAFTDKNFQKSVEKDRKLEPYVLMFYSSATKANQKYAQLTSATDDSWKETADRHMAMFIRLVAQTLRDQGHDRDRPELMSRLHTLENKLLTRDQNLSLDSAGDGGSYIEVLAPLSYDVKDMPLVLTVARIFGRSNSEVQADLEANRQVWTEENAIKDMKNYQQRLASDAPGALRSQDFDLEDAYQEWKRAEAPHLSQIILEILTVKPELAKTSTAGADKSLPGRPQSTFFGEEQSYSEISKSISSPDGSIMNFDSSINFGSLSLDDSNQPFDEAVYTFIPNDARAFYKAILKDCMTYDQLHADPAAEYTPLSQQSKDLLMELSVYWRLPQFSRLISFIEVAVKKFLDGEILADDLLVVMDNAKSSEPERKKAPHVHQYNVGLLEIDQSRWTMHDFAVYQQTLNSLYDALLRDLYNLMLNCYGPKPPNIGSVMTLLEDHVQSDPAFSARPEQAQEFAVHLTEGLRRAATDAYNAFVHEKLPNHASEWEFTHVVELGRAVTKLSNKIQKRYKNLPEVMGVKIWQILVEVMFPSYERDAQHIIERTIAVAKEKEMEINMQDGFDLYKELVEMRRTHHAALPDKPFEFQIEELLVDFVWRWVRNAENVMVEVVDGAISQDSFQVRTDDPNKIPTDAERHSTSVIDIFLMFHQTMEQVYQLEWDSDVHHARFMTALARSYAAGIGQYCDELEKRFAKEMDRPTAQEIAANKTTQEKFMQYAQYARDAWNPKDAPEPFQFFPESFVKLNNIEHAMQELDKLEKAMNVDACAEVLRKAEGLGKQQAKRPNKYVFTIKVVEAEDLKACDPGGFSDPYVVLGDEYQKRLYKTRIVHKSLNPRWDESVDITVSSPLNIIATIWDYDTFGDHDFVGRTSLKVDPIHFSDYLPREYWLDLDTQGRILLRVSMEGERDDIQFYFGKAFRHLKRTERDMVRKITDKLRAQISATISHETLRSLVRGGGIGSQVAGLWKKRASTMPTVTTASDIEGALQPLFHYFDQNFAIMKQTLTDATMLAVMTRLWKEVLQAIEHLLVPPLSEKPSSQRPLSQKELDIVYQWLNSLFEFFNAKDESGEQLGVPQDVLKSPKWHELAALNFFYFEQTDNLIRESERMAAANAQRATQMLLQEKHENRLSAPATFGPTFSGGPGAFASMGTIRRGKSIMMSRNLGTMRKAKEEKRKEAQADPSDDMILRILRMRPEAANYLRERHRQKERQAAAAAAALIVKNSVNQGWNTGVRLHIGLTTCPDDEM